MPKRLKSKTVQSSKKLRNSSSTSSNKRTSIPRNCKSSSTPKKKKVLVDFDFLSKSTNKTNMGTNQGKINDKEPGGKKEKKEMPNWSSDDEECGIVYDLQEEKKNKVYEVITVMSDDETPNKISYERIYADDPEKRAVEMPEVFSDSVEIDVVNVTEDKVVNNSDVMNDNRKKGITDLGLEVDKMDNVGVIIPKQALKTNDTVDLDTKSDSDNEVICVAVIDAKTKEEQRKAKIEEICLSSDSEPENQPTVPPLRLHLPVTGFPYVNKYLRNDGSNHSFDSNNGNFPLGFRHPIYPNAQQHKPPDMFTPVYGWNTYSPSSKATSSDDFSPGPPDSPKFLTGDDSSSSAVSELSKTHQNSSSDNENSSSPSSSSDEEKDIYWKAERESRRKQDLRYEEYTDLGKKIHEGKTTLDDNSSFIFKVMSYNVLAQNLLEHHMYLYKNHDRRALGWARRWTLIYNEIKDENPEILCLQEVEQKHLMTHYTKLLDLGYRWIYKKRTNDYQDGVAVFYKASVFENEDHALVEFYQPGVSVLDRENVGVVVRLRLKDFPNQAIVIANTHLLYNPKRSDVKLAQMQVLLAEIDRLAYNKDALTYYPIILTGDFNLKPRHGVYQLLTEGKLTYEGTSRKTLRPSSDKNVLPKTLLPCRLGITDRCQHVGVVEARVKGEDPPKTKLYHSEHNKVPVQDTNYLDEDCSKDERFESGTLCHGFNFQSVYPNEKINGQSEASTYHESWVTVDYIFYSIPKAKEGQKNEEGSLQLLSRLRLPTQDECERFLRHLPNFAFGSDHLPLVGKFLLRVH